MPKLGEVLVREGFLNREQMKAALNLQQKQQIYLPLGELCVQENYISQEELQSILRKYHKTIPLGELLLNMKLITGEQLRECLAQGKKTGQKLGEVLVEKDYIDETSLVKALSIQLGIPKIVPSLDLIDRTLLERFNAEFLLKHHFIPAFKDGNEYTVIMADPINQDNITLLRRMLKAEVKPAIASKSEIQKALQVYLQKLEIGQKLDTGEASKDLVIGESEMFKRQGDNIIDIVNYLITDAINERATDIHIEPQERFLRIRYRIDGILHHKTDLPSNLTPKLTSRIKAICGLDIAETRKHQDGRIQARIMKREYDLRVSTYSAIWGENLVIRIQNRKGTLIDINKLGFTSANLKRFTEMLDHPAGIILVTGPTGSGKSTTLYASLQYINKLERSIITVEDPVEYTIDGVVQASLPKKIQLNYPDYLKAMMRQDPDVLMIGEIRDANAAEAVIQASLTGHKVLTTFHTEDSTGALLRLMDMGIETFLISSTVVSVVAQRLIRKLCEHCKQKVNPNPEKLAFFKTLDTSDLIDHIFYQPRGCVHCSETGYKGMTAIHELLLVNDAIRDEILKRSTSSRIRSIAREHANLTTMSEDGFYKALRGVTSLDEIIRVVYRYESSGLKAICVTELTRRCERPTDKIN